MHIIYIDNPHPALAKQHALACHIFLKARMFIRADMIRLQVCKNTDVKQKAAYTVHHKSLRRYLHNTGIAACLYHSAEIFLYKIGFWCRICRRDMLITDYRFYRTDQADFRACAFKDRFDHIRRSRLSLRAGNADCPKLPGRMAEPRSRKLSQRKPRIFYQHCRHARRDTDLSFYNYGCRLFFSCLSDTVMPVKRGTAYAYKYTSGHNLSGIVDQS